MELGTFLTRQYQYNAGMTRQMLDAVTANLTEDELNWQARPGHHSIWHHVWHMFLSNDYYFAYAMQHGAGVGVGRLGASASISRRWRACSTILATRTTDRALASSLRTCRTSLVDELKAPSLPAYLAYVDDMLAKTTEVLSTRDGGAVEASRRLLSIRPDPGARVATSFAHCVAAHWHDRRRPRPDPRPRSGHGEYLTAGPSPAPPLAISFQHVSQSAPTPQSPLPSLRSRTGSLGRGSQG